MKAGWISFLVILAGVVWQVHGFERQIAPHAEGALNQRLPGL
jgi:hypothetical protein